MGLEQLLGNEAVNEIKGRNFGIDPNSRYSKKEFLERAEELLLVDAYQKEVTNNGWNIGALNGLAGIALKYMPGDKAENLKILKNPFAAAEQAKALLTPGYKNIAGYTERNLGRILNEMDEKGLAEIAAMLSEMGEELKDIQTYRAKGDAKGMKALYLKLYGKDPVVRNFAEKIEDADFFMKLYPRDIAARKESFLTRFADKEGYDKDKLKQYIKAQLGSVKEEDKPKVYTNIALSVYELLREREEPQERTAEKEELRIAA